MIEKLKKGLTRDEVKNILGGPTDTGTTSKKYRLPLVYRYGQFEIAFGPKKEDGLIYVMDIGESAQEHNFLIK